MAFSPKGKGKWKFWKKKSNFKEELLAIDRVTRVTSWGRQLRFRAVMVVWDGKGQVALWTWKSWEVVDAIAKAITNAKKKLVTVTIDNGTVPYDVKVKYKAPQAIIHVPFEAGWTITWAALYLTFTS